MTKTTTNVVTITMGGDCIVAGAAVMLGTMNRTDPATGDASDIVCGHTQIHTDIHIHIHLKLHVHDQDDDDDDGDDSIPVQ